MPVRLIGWQKYNFFIPLCDSPGLSQESISWLKPSHNITYNRNGKLQRGLQRTYSSKQKINMWIKLIGVKKHTCCHIRVFENVNQHRFFHTEAACDRQNEYDNTVTMRMVCNQFKHRTSHEPNSINWVRLMWSTAFDLVKFGWFHLDWLSRSSPLAQAWTTAEDRLRAKHRLSRELN